jgi:V/A-type H+-transporting ATPase subunit B
MRVSYTEQLIGVYSIGTGQPRDNGPNLRNQIDIGAPSVNSGKEYHSQKHDPYRIPGYRRFQYLWSKPKASDFLRQW